MSQTIEFVLLSGVRPNKYYNLILFNRGIRMTEIQLGMTDKTNIKETMPLGKLVEIMQHGRPYDPDISLRFETENGETLFYEPSFGSTEAYVEYIPDTEEDSIRRIQERTMILRDEILGNDWALRPENVVATQGIDLSGWARKN